MVGWMGGGGISFSCIACGSKCHGLKVPCRYPSTGPQDGWKVTEVFFTLKVTLHVNPQIAAMLEYCFTVTSFAINIHYLWPFLLLICIYNLNHYYIVFLEYTLQMHFWMVHFYQHVLMHGYSSIWLFLLALTTSHAHLSTHAFYQWLKN